MRECFFKKNLICLGEPLKVFIRPVCIWLHLVVKIAYYKKRMSKCAPFAGDLAMKNIRKPSSSYLVFHTVYTRLTRFRKEIRKNPQLMLRLLSNQEIVA